MPAIMIRKAHIPDLDSLEMLHIETQEHHRLGKPNIFKRLTPGTALREHILSYINGDCVATFLAEELGKAAGFVQAKIEVIQENIFQAEQRRGLINAIGVAASSRRCGVGSLLMEAAETWVKEQGLSEALLNVWSFNEMATRFYLDRGYTTQSLKLSRDLHAKP